MIEDFVYGIKFAIFYYLIIPYEDAETEVPLLCLALKDGAFEPDDGLDPLPLLPPIPPPAICGFGYGLGSGFGAGFFV